MKERKAYQCSFCTFYRLTKKSVEIHEDNCYHNPKNRACATCRFNVVEFETVYDRYHGGNPGSTDYDVPYNWCDKREIELSKNELRMYCSMHKLKEGK